MAQRNCIRIHCRSPWSTEFFYFDSPDYAADEIFARFGIVPRFFEEMQPPDCRYVFIRCRVKRKQAHVFIEAMEELGRKMLLTGHDDYFDTSEDFISRLEAYETGTGRSRPDEEALNYELMRADVENLRLYLTHIKNKYPDIFAEIEEKYDGMPGFVEMKEVIPCS